MSNELTFFLSTLLLIGFAGTMTSIVWYGDYKEKKIKHR